ncbi:hypothetical protein [Oceanicola sp. 502str15]|uniref:hypothetical protein n=1 Tax=Oceanicola sp. 502str15 TaxID=2696061 RepID=UPI002095438F|nr:hypothetical protein [Oceanicola sp. 502str15]MCO6383631.1 hypothetical protein [Oceanicola sp. 502str15]
MIRAAALVAALAASPALAAPLLEFRIGPVAAEAEAEDIVSVAPVLDGPPGFDITISERFSRDIARLTTAHVGEEARLSICGEVVVRPRIMEPISGTGFRLVPIAPEKAEPYLLWLTGRAPCPED